MGLGIILGKLSNGKAVFFTEDKGVSVTTDWINLFDPTSEEATEIDMLKPKWIAESMGWTIIK